MAAEPRPNRWAVDPKTRIPVDASRRWLWTCERRRVAVLLRGKGNRRKSAVPKYQRRCLRQFDANEQKQLARWPTTFGGWERIGGLRNNIPRRKSGAPRAGDKPAFPIRIFLDKQKAPLGTGPSCDMCLWFEAGQSSALSRRYAVTFPQRTQQKGRLPERAPLSLRALTTLRARNTPRPRIIEPHQVRPAFLFLFSL